MSRTAKKLAPVLFSEHEEQVFLFQWAEKATGRYPELKLLHAIPNFARVSPRWGAWMKAEGKRAGVPDVHLPVPRGGYASLYIELKVGKNQLSPSQEMWAESLRAAKNYVVACWGWEVAREAIESYLALS